ncbi:hypothetical protein ZWY2020_003760 [Hordeum vulgare]|nr:hypothetical protein ZWY2020_003760 [Hordeum vulgare]
MDESHPSLGTAREAAEAPAVEASRNAPTPTPQLRTTEEEMSFLVSNIQGMEKKVFEILLNQKSLKRIVETKLCDLDVKVTKLTTTIEHLQHEVDSVKTPRSSGDDEESPLPTTTHFRAHSRSTIVPVLEARPSS